MRIAFITPTIVSLDPRWRQSPQLVKLAVPTIAGYLHACGHQDIRQYDFETDVLDLERREPGKLNLAAFIEDAPTDRFLAGQRGDLAEQVALLCDTLGVERADVFGLSCASVASYSYEEAGALTNINLALAHELKARYPACRTVIGGSCLPGSMKTETYRQMIRRCSALDFAVVGPGEAPMLHIVEHLAGTRPLAESGEPLERVGHATLLLGSSYTMAGVRRDDVSGVDGPPAPVTAAAHPPRAGRDASLPSASAAAIGAVHPIVQEMAECKDTAGAPPFIPPLYDPVEVAKRRRSGLETLRLHNLGEERVRRLAAHHDRDVFVVPMMFVMGCGRGCAFCPFSMLSMHSHDVDEVVRAIAWLSERHGTRYFHFLNTHINGSRAYAEAFVDALLGAELGILWSDSASLRALDERLLEKMRRAGMIRLVTGLECPSDRLLKYVHKGVTVARATELLRFSHELGIWNHNQFIAGMPTQTDDDLAAFTDFLEATGAYTDALNVSPFYLPYNSRMASFPERYGLRIIEDPDAPQENAAFDEIDGLRWADKCAQITRSTEWMWAEIERVKGHKHYLSSALPLDLLFFLYESLGHEAKAEIVATVEEARVGPRDDGEPDAPIGEEADGEAWTAPPEGSEESVWSEEPEPPPPSVTPQVQDPHLARLVELLGEAQPTFARHALHVVEVLGDAEILIALRGAGGDDPLDLIVTPAATTKRCYAAVGAFAMSHRIETPLTTPEHAAAVAALLAYMEGL